ncbi:uncharacterized protein A4U43_C03F30470 [Asparagus officinalis]|uniref:Uncharacterized protein n=1 Tax=Asparagus officinalis TaxID=4686 RepID=A0A5P1FG06_ASPOF|nr:protein trichome birefringence-like 25 [Asparagus officinalis]ONK76643.1 uncharacterized protein A4U43_C03F30470 [Asparagus officinalis]
MAIEHWRQILMLLFISLVFIGAVNAEFLRFKHQNSPIKEQCDIFRGKWISDPLNPPYTENCNSMDYYLNCLKNGRPNREYLHWRWKPYDCDLPHFDSEIFSDMMKDKSFAFVGDSLARNQMESLMCLLSKVEDPQLVYQDATIPRTRTWYFPSFNFSLASIWSPFLVQPDSPIVDVLSRQPIRLHLDNVDSSWASRYHEFDYLLVGVGAWFDHRTIIMENNSVVGCHDCKYERMPEIGTPYIYHKAAELAFNFMIASEHKPFVMYRTHTPNHFENGRWDQHGNCNRTMPFKEGEFEGDERDRELLSIGREDFTKAANSAEGCENLRLLDIFHLSVLRPDGHPDKYRGLEGLPNDCLHWCMPGPIDAWNDLMMEMILRRREELEHGY